MIRVRRLLVQGPSDEAQWGRVYDTKSGTDGQR